MNREAMIALPPEFEIPPETVAKHVARLREAAAAPLPQGRPRLGPLLLAAAVFVIAAAIAAAATTGLFDREVTRADLDARLTITTRTVQECSAPGRCSPPREERVGIVIVLPADGITLVDPDGLLLALTPATGTFGYESVSRYGRELGRSLGEEGGVRRATLELPGGGTRTFSWVDGEGTATVVDTHASGARSEAVLRSGDVVPLIPGTLDGQPRTPDKAVTFDLADGDYPVWIYPQRNEAYVGDSPWRRNGVRPEIPEQVARRYGLSERGPAYTLPVEASGGHWTYALGDGTIRTVSWAAGETTVTVTDRDGTGRVLGTETIPIGRRVSAG